MAYFPLKGNPKEYLPGAPVARLTPLLMKGSGERNTHLDYKLNYSVSTTQPSGSVALHGKTTTLTCALSLMVGVMETNKYWASLSDEDMKAIHRVDKEEEGTS